MSNIKLNKLKNVLENRYEENGKALTISEKLEKVFGVTEETADCVNEQGQVETHVFRKKIDPQAAKDLDNVGPAAIGRTFLGSQFESQAKEAMKDPTFFSRCRTNMNKVLGATEADSTGVTASMMEPLNTWGSFTLGLYDFKVLDGYQSIEAVYEDLMPTVPTLIHGAQKHMRSEFEGTVNLKPIVETNPADTVGQKPIHVWTQEVDEFQFQYAVTQEAMLSDLSGQLSEMGVGVGKSLKKAENYRAGRVYLGYLNTYCFNTADNSTPSCNTFQSSAGTKPFDFVNLYYSNALTDVDTLNTAWLNMQKLTDPAKGWRLDVGKEFDLVVSPDLVFKAGEIVKLITSYRATQSGISTSNGRLGASENPLVIAGLDIAVKNMTYEWRDVLTGTSPAPVTWRTYDNKEANGSNTNPITGTADSAGALMSAGNIAGFWMLVARGKKYAIHEPWIPLRSNVYPLSGDDLARRIALRGDSYVASRFTVLEPRYAQINLPLASGN